MESMMCGTSRDLMRRNILWSIAGMNLLSVVFDCAGAQPPIESTSQRESQPASSYEAIRNLMATYSFFFDSGNYRAYAELFAHGFIVVSDTSSWPQSVDDPIRERGEYEAARQIHESQVKKR